MLNPFINASNSLDEVVFANRNKTYGAYALRKEYDARITKSLCIVLSSFVLLFLVALIYPKVFPAAPSLKKPPVVPYTILGNDDIIFDVNLSGGGAKATNTSHPATHPATSLPKNKVDQFDFQITTNIPAHTETSSSEHTETSGSQEGIGTSNTGAVGDVSGTETGGSGSGLQGAEAPMVSFMPDVFPEFSQGDLHQYLASQINYPPQALTVGVQGKVIIVFDVLADGTIANARIQKGIGFGCDEEALRVVKNMPAWKPGKQQGKAVAVRMSLPIKFEMRN